MTNIQPLIIPIVGTATKLVVRVLPFDMTATNCDFYYGLLDADDKTLIEGNLNMNDTDFAAWGADNQYCIQWAANKLGITLI